MKTALSSDTSCTISKEKAKLYNINIFALNVIVDGVEYLDGVSINHDQLNSFMRKGAKIKTSTPPILQIKEYFEKLFAKGYDYIIHFTISSKLSSMYDLFTNVSKEYFNNKVIVIDSYSVCSLMLSHVYFALDELNKGTDPKEIKKLVQKRLTDNYVCFIPENLTALKNGGRISPSIAALGNMIGLKPVLLLKEGGLEKSSMTRQVKKSINSEFNKISESFPTEKYDYSIVSFDGDDHIITSMKNIVLARFPDCEIKVFDIAINVCAHCGPGTVGLIISPKINGKSINEF